MTRERSGEDLINDAYRRADCESATDRHPRTDVLRYVNQGAAELWDILIEARGGEYFQADPFDITTTADTSSYDLPDDFYMLLSVRMSSPIGDPLVAYTAQEEASLRDPTLTFTGYPSSYQLRRSVAGANTIVLLPEHDADLTITVNYVPGFEDLEDDSNSVFDGINGWEEYASNYAACCILTKDDELELVNAIQRDMAKMRARILKLAPKRNMHRARRVIDVRGPKIQARRWY